VRSHACAVQSSHVQIMPGGKHDNMKAWEPEEDRIIMAMVRDQGPKWKNIVKELPTRTVSSVRNRYQRLEKGRQLREEGVELKNKCHACGQPKRGHTCLAKLQGGPKVDVAPSELPYPPLALPGGGPQPTAQPAGSKAAYRVQGAGSKAGASTGTKGISGLFLPSFSLGAPLSSSLGSSALASSSNPPLPRRTRSSSRLNPPDETSRAHTPDDPPQGNSILGNSTDARGDSAPLTKHTGEESGKPLEDHGRYGAGEGAAEGMVPDLQR